MNDAGMDGEELLDRVRALRATGRTPKEIARALGLRPAQVVPLVGDIAAEAHAGASERKLAGCWVSPGWSLGLSVEGHPGWPDVDAADAEALGLVSVLVTRQERYGRLRLCGWLVDVYCLGVKDVVGPRVMDERRAADFHSSFFAAYQARPLEAPPELAQHLVFGAVEYARSLGFEPARGFTATTDQLGSWAGPSAISFGRDGKPFLSRARTTRPTPCCRRWSVPLGPATSPSWSRHSRKRRRRSRRATAESGCQLRKTASNSGARTNEAISPYACGGTPTVLVDIRSMPPQIQAEARRRAWCSTCPNAAGVTGRHAALSFRVMSTDAVSGTRPRSRLERRVVAAAEALLARDRSVSPVGVLAAIGWLPQSAVDRWRQGRVECLEQLAPVRPDKLAAALEHLRGWAAGNGLATSEVAYVVATRDQRPLRFTADGDQATERAWRTHWMRADLPEAAPERLTRRQSKPPDLVVIEPLNEWRCTACGGSGWVLFMEGPGPLCMDCADLGHLVFLPAGNAALSRRAKRASRLSAVVVRFSRARKRYERQGILVDEAALEQAEAQCLADENARSRRRERDRERRADQDVVAEARLAEAVARLFPGCPARRAAAIARHAAVRGSGRIGRSAAGRALDEQAVTLAVIASVRHQDTDYDELLMAGVPRAVAREQVRPAVDRVLAAWQHP